MEAPPAQRPPSVTIDPTPTSVDLFEKFSYLRIAYRKHQQKQVEKPLAKYKLISFALGQRRSKPPNAPVDPLLVPENDKSPSCRICGKPFGSRKSVVCLICGRRVDATGCSAKLVVEDELNQATPDSIDACTECHQGIEWHRRRLSIKVRNTKAEEGAFRQLHRIVIESRDSVAELIPKLRALTKIPHNEITLAEWEHAQELEVNLSEFFSAIEIGTKKLTGGTVTNSRDKTVLTNVRNAILQFLQLYQPEFRLLQKEAKDIPKPPADRKPKPKPKPAAPKGQGPYIRFERRAELKRQTAGAAGKAAAAPQSSPVIASIYPIVCPLAGAEMTVTGSDFHPGVRATLVGPTLSKAADVDWVDVQNLRVTGPRLPSAIYGLQVTNPDGGHALLPDIIIYSDEPFKNAAAAEPEFMPELKAREKKLSEEEARRSKAEEAKRQAAAPAKPAPLVPRVLTEDDKKRMEEERRREARKNWGKAPDSLSPRGNP